MSALIWGLFAISSLINKNASTQYGLSNSFVYRIVTKRRLDEFINSKNGGRLESKVIQLNNLDFQLHFYPNGRLEHQENQFVVYLCINNLSEKTKISSIFVDWTFVIYETNFSYIVKDRHHSDNAKCRGFTIYDNAQIMEPLKKLYEDQKNPLKKLSFGITIATKTRFNTQQIIDSQIPIQINKHNKFVWNIENKDILHGILLSQHQQTYVSDLYDDLFFLSMTPNGYHEAAHNSLDMFLHVVYLPKEISKLRMKCIFKISELKIIHHFNAEWTNLDKGWGWPTRKFPIDMLKLYASSSKLDKLTIISECETTDIFDQNGNAMKMNKKWKYFRISAKNSTANSGSALHLPKLFNQDTNNNYCLEPGNMSSNYHFQNINRILIDMSQDMDIVRQQLFIIIGIFTMNFGVTVFMFSVLISLLCCGCF